MHIIQDVLIPGEFLTKELYFCCNPRECGGACCVAGDAGAPLEPEEIGFIQDGLEFIKPYMQKDAASHINNENLFDYDQNGEFVTALFKDTECIFTNFESGIAFCAIEKAYNEKKITFRKPASCFLYPIRVSKQGVLRKIAYHRWDICQSAVELGKKKKIKLHEFLNLPLKEKFGEEWLGHFYEFINLKQK